MPSLSRYDLLKMEIGSWFSVLTRAGETEAEARRAIDHYISTYYTEYSNPMPYVVRNGDMVWLSQAEYAILQARANKGPLVAVTDEVPARPAQGCACKGCKLSKGEPCYVVNGMLRAYSYEPRPWRFYMTKSEKTRNDYNGVEPGYYLGVELETDKYRLSTSKTRVQSVVSQKVAIGLRQPKQLWIAKRDSSVSGPEFVSHPATMNYWNEKAPQLAEMFTDLLHAGYRSYDTDRCGMHINLSKTAFGGDSTHLFRFISLIYGNPQMSMRLSQRTAASAKRWATVEEFQTATYTMEDVARHVIDGTSLSDPSTGYYRGRPRTTALNAEGYYSKRLEFRLPRGTLRLERFFKNLEWMVAMVEYSREAEAKDMTAKRFLGYVTERRRTYPNLFTFMKERTKIALAE